MIECVEIDRYQPRSDFIRDLGISLHSGELIACPTDSTYGVFASIDSPDAAQRLKRLRLKMAGDNEHGASPDKPFSLVFSDLKMMSEYAVLSTTAYRAVKRLFPGPYTIILPANRAVPRKLQTKRRHVGARIPADPLARRLVAQHGLPVLSTTAKDADGQLLGDAISLSEAWPTEIDKVVDSGPFLPEPSTVLSVEGDELVVIRHGRGSLDL